MLLIILIYLFFGKILTTHYTDFIPYRNIISAFWSTFNIDCMAIGGIYAIFLFQKSKILKIIMNNTFFYLTLFLLTNLLIKGFYMPSLHFDIYSVLFEIIILNFAANDKIGISLVNKILNYLGNISYGLYMYHPIGIVLALAITVSIDYITNWLLYPLSLAITIIIAGLSYKYFEAFFLKYKNKYSNIFSGNSTNG